jgi:peroxiredoxin
VLHLVGCSLPDIELPASGGGTVGPLREEGWAVYFVYPYTGRAGYADPLNWDHIPGAHGSTQQALAYSNTYAHFQMQNVKIFGVSLQALEWQIEFVQRNRLVYPLLSDHLSQLSYSLKLPRFETGGMEFLSRLTLIVKDGVVQFVRFPVLVPADDADESLKWLALRK